MLEIIQGHGTQNLHFRAEMFDKRKIHPGNLLGLGTGAHDFRDDFRQGDKRSEPGMTHRSDRSRTIRQFQNPAEHAHSQGLAADRADVFVRMHLARIHDHPALAVPVQMVLALFGIELHGSPKLRGRKLPLESPENPGIVFGPVKDIGLTPQIGPGVGIGIGDKGVFVQIRPQPVHGRVRGESGLQGENLRGQIPEAFLHGVEARFGPEYREPRCPDMRGNEMGLQDHFQEISGIEPQNGPTVGFDIADLGEPGVEFFHGIQIGHVHEIVHLPDLVTPLVDGTDLGTEQKPGPTRQFHPLHAGNLAAQPLGILEAKQPALVGLELVFEHGHPPGMGEIPGPDHVEPLDARPGSQVAKGQILAGGPGKPGMNMQIGQKRAHGSGSPVRRLRMDECSRTGIGNAAKSPRNMPSIRPGGKGQGVFFGGDE